MKDLFLEVVKLSLAGSVFVAAVVLLRLLLKKAPRWVFCLLWGFAALRLMFPLQIETEISLMPPAISQGQAVTGAMSGFVGDTSVFYEGSANFDAALEAGRVPVTAPGGNFVITQTGSLKAPVTVGHVLAWIWLAGLVAMLGYGAASWFLLRRRICTATRRENNIWESEQVDSPFVLGLLRPRIYLPYDLDPVDREHVIAHEKAHLRRGDHWWKPLGFLILSVYWFNPLIWVAYVLLCRDIESACDEKVIGSMTKDEMRAYSRALLNCSVHRKRITACPVAFGEVSARERIKSVMHYKKPAFWIVMAAVAVSVVAAVLLLTDPRKNALPGENLPEETVSPTAPSEKVPAYEPLGPPESEIGNIVFWDTPLLGYGNVVYEIINAYSDPTDPEHIIYSYRFYSNQKDGSKKEILTVDYLDYALSADIDNDDVTELFVRVCQGGEPYRLYDVIDGQIQYTEPELVPDGMLSYRVLMRNDLYLYKERWVRFFREPLAYIRQLADLSAETFYTASPSGVIPSEISGEQFREAYLEIVKFLTKTAEEDQRTVAFRMLLELDQNCAPETAVELAGNDPYKLVFDKRAYTRQDTAQWQNCLSQMGVLFDREPGALLQAMAARKENFDAEIDWLVSTRFYYDREALARQLKLLEQAAETEAETQLAETFRLHYDSRERPVMNAVTLLSGTGEELWNALIWDTEAVVRCFRNVEVTERNRLRGLLMDMPVPPEQRSLEKCYEALEKILDKKLTETEEDVAYMILVQLEFMGGFREPCVAGEAFDYNRLFAKMEYTDGAFAENWSLESKEVFLQSPMDYLLGLRDWNAASEQKNRVLLNLAYSFYGEDSRLLAETVRSLRRQTEDPAVLEMLQKLEESMEPVQDTSQLLGTWEAQNGSSLWLDGGVFGIPYVWAQQVSVRQHPEDDSRFFFTYRFGCYGDGKKQGTPGDPETELLTLECAGFECVDYDGDGVTELLAQVADSRNPYRLYDLEDGQLMYLEGDTSNFRAPTGSWIGQDNRKLYSYEDYFAFERFFMDTGWLRERICDETSSYVPEVKNSRLYYYDNKQQKWMAIGGAVYGDLRILGTDDRHWIYCVEDSRELFRIDPMGRRQDLYFDPTGRLCAGDLDENFSHFNLEDWCNVAFFTAGAEGGYGIYRLHLPSGLIDLLTTESEPISMFGSVSNYQVKYFKGAYLGGGETINITEGKSWDLSSPEIAIFQELLSSDRNVQVHKVEQQADGTYRVWYLPKTEYAYSSAMNWEEWVTVLEKTADGWQVLSDTQAVMPQ